uniref:Uncharacterized protein n=1 Tax=Arundo donax TaxID=35708 RepID=A0A0A9CW14_ARUDO
MFCWTNQTEFGVLFFYLQGKFDIQYSSNTFSSVHSKFAQVRNETQQELHEPKRKKKKEKGWSSVSGFGCIYWWYKIC